MRFIINDETISAAPANASRLLQNTTFSYTDDHTKGTGQIGLSGALRLRGAFPGILVSKELTLSIDATKVNLGSMGNQAG